MISSTHSSPSTSSLSKASLDVSRLCTDKKSVENQTAFVIKLSDECLKAVQKAHKARLPLRINFGAQGGAIEIGSGDKITRFKFVCQSLSDTPLDAITYDYVSGAYTTVASVKAKIQVQTTEKSFAETREKAYKMAEAEKRKKTELEQTKHKHDTHSLTIKRATHPVAITAQKPSAPVVKSNATDLMKNNSTKVTINGTSVSNTAVAGAHSYVKAEISRRPLRKRVIHLVVLGNFHNIDEIISQLQKDSITEDICYDDIIKVRDMIGEVSDVNRDTGRLHLKPAFLNEVDPRWPGFNSDEKSFVRKIQSSNVGAVSNFAPMRKKGIAPMSVPGLHANSANAEGTQASLAKETHSKKPDSFKKPSSDLRNNCSNNGSVNTDTGSDDSVCSSVSTTNGFDRKRSQNFTNTSLKMKRLRQTSLSSPEDPTCTSQHPSQNLQKNAIRNEKPKQINGHTGHDRQRQQSPAVHVNGDANSTVNSTTSSSSINSPINSNCSHSDWMREFVEPRSLAEAEKYYEMFNAIYPAYMECYNRLTSISKEFIQFDRQLKEVPKNSREYGKLEQAVKAKYLQYERDPEFRQTRSKHSDLRGKLEALKKRIATWEVNYAKSLSCGTGDKKHELKL